MSSQKLFSQDPFQVLLHQTCSFFSSYQRNRKKYLAEQSAKESYLEQERKVISPLLPDQCPTCGHSPVATILWGLPDFKSPGLQSSMEAGKIVWGGCIVGNDDPTWQCIKCGQSIWKTGSGPTAKLIEYSEKLQQLKRSESPC